VKLDNARPLYEQLKQTILRDIVSEVYKHGERLPSEPDLARKYGISRITVRRSLSELAEEGYLSTQQGRGTFVNYLKIPRYTKSFDGFSETHSPSMRNRILSKSVVKADVEMASWLMVQPGTPLIKLHRLMSESDKPYLIDTAYFVESMYPGLLDLLADNVSTFGLMRGHYHIEFAKADKTLGVIRAGVMEAELLKCTPGDPLFSITKLIYDRLDVPVHYSHYLVLGDMCIYTLRVVGEKDDTLMHFRSEIP
jgi:GntR family transcriptional regulator, frlABCD operon transcriptional regulator